MIILASRCFPLYRCLLFFLLLGCASTEGIIAEVGTDVTLACNYDATYYGRLFACWGRGAIPNSGCANEVIKSDGTSVISRLSERYVLMGNLGQGDVSLTIRQVEESDSGMYGCRVEIPGWFNDHKHEHTLTVVAARPNTMTVATREVRERSITVRWNSVFDGGRPITSYRVDLKNKQAPWELAVKTQVSNSELTQVTLVDLRPAKTYNLRIFAINSVGMSASSNVLTVTTKEAAPEGPPLDVQLEALTSHSIKVTWKPPSADLRNGVLRSYTISYREHDTVGNAFKRWHHQSIPATRERESTVLTNLTPSTTYGVLIQTKTNAGIGPASTVSLCSTLDEVHTTSAASSIKSTSPAATEWIQDTSAHTTSTASAVKSTSPAVTEWIQDTSAHTTSAASAVKSTSPAVTVWIQDTSFTTVHPAFTAEPAATVWGQSTTSIISVPPDPPVVELKEVTHNAISLFWIPGFEGDSPITGYYLEYKTENASWDYTKTVVDFSPNQTKATIIEIIPSTYNIRMFAKNLLGTSRASNVLTITTGEAGHQRDSLTTTTPTDANAAAIVKEGHSRHLAAIVVPVVLVVLTVAIAMTWQLRRIKQTQGSFSMWVNGRAVRYREAESLQEL